MVDCCFLYADYLFQWYALSASCHQSEYLAGERTLGLVFDVRNYKEKMCIRDSHKIGQYTLDVSQCQRSLLFHHIRNVVQQMCIRDRSVTLFSCAVRCWIK